MRISPLLIFFLILTTFSLDDGWIFLGENGCLLLLDGSHNNYWILPPIFEQLKKNVHVCLMCVLLF